MGPRDDGGVKPERVGARPVLEIDNLACNIGVPARWGGDEQVQEDVVSDAWAVVANDDSDFPGDG